MNQTAEVLMGAADHLDTFGWVQDLFYADSNDVPHSAACAVGAIRVAIKKLDYPAGAEDDAIDVLVEYVELSAHPASLDDIANLDAITAWNDDPDTTRNAVTEALRRAAKELEEAT